MAGRPARARNRRGATSVPTDQQVLDTFPRDPIDHDNKEHYRSRLQHRLLINRCTDCGHWS